MPPRKRRYSPIRPDGCEEPASSNVWLTKPERRKKGKTKKEQQQVQELELNKMTRRRAIEVASKQPYSLISITMILTITLLPIIVPLLSMSGPTRFWSASGQLIIDHPRHRQSARFDRFTLSPYLYRASLAPQSYESQTSSAKNEGENGNEGNERDIIQVPDLLTNPVKLKQFHAAENISHFSSLPSSKDKQNELLRRLSASMLIETLLSHPMPFNQPPFLPLPLPSFSHSFNRSQKANPKLKSTSSNRTSSNRQNTKSKKRNKIRPRLPSSIDNPSMIVLQTSPSNLTTTTGNASMLTDTRSTDSFNASSLNYLVDKLLAAKSFNSSDPQSRRPSLRRPTIKETKNTSSIVNKGVNFNDSTLDMLIKDEYDSRVEPMMKSLLVQQKLSTEAEMSSPNSMTTKFGSNNHRTDENTSSTTTSSVSESPITELNTIPVVRSKIVTPHKTISTKISELIDPDEKIDKLVNFEDLQDLEGVDEEIDMDEKNSTEAIATDDNLSAEVSLRNRTLSKKKTLQNVPPYQLGDSRATHDVKSAKVDTPATETPSTTSTTNEPTTTEFKIQRPTQRVVKLKLGDKFADASTRGSLVYSDGGEEAERANKRRLQRLTNKNSSDNSIQSRRDNNIAMDFINLKSDKSNGSVLLTQLLSTVDPLIDLDLKLKKHQPHVKNPRDTMLQHPIVYKDDYLFSSTNGDWSRPVGTRDNSVPATTYRNVYTHFYSTTPAPPTDPPSVPYNYFLHQPVTNAQSVPSMVIPTSDSVVEITTNPPAIYGQNRIRIPMPPPQLGSSHAMHELTPNSNKNTLLIPMTVDRMPSSNVQERKYSYQLPEKPNIHQVQQINETIHNVNKSQSMKTDTIGLANNDRQIELISMNSKNTSSSRQNWLPKIGENSSPPLQNQEPSIDYSFSNRGQATDSGPPVLVSIVGTKTSSTVNLTDDGRSSSELSHGDSHDSGESTSVLEAPPANEAVQTRKKSNTRNKTTFSRLPSKTSDSADDNDSISEQKPSKGTQPKRPLRKQPSHHDESEKGPSAQYENARDNGESDDVSSDADQETVQQQQPHNSTTGNKSKAYSKHRITKKVPHLISHDTAGSEVFLTEFDKKSSLSHEQHQPNHTRLLNRRPLKVSTGDQSMDISDGSVYVSGPETPVLPSFSSTIIPNTNFFSDASSESPTLDNSISILSSQARPRHPSTFNNEDPYHRTSSSNSIFSTVQQSNISSVIPTLSPKTTTGTTVGKGLDDQSNGMIGAGSGNSKQPGSQPGKSSNDRLAFILIGGSCALSVVCLVLAAMSMRCQDMCDDYRSLRNAERAALRLQKHRLKYTKNHQVNRSNQSSSIDVGHNIIGDVMQNASHSEELEIGQTKNPKCLNSKSIQFNGQNMLKNDLNTADGSIWSPNSCQLPVPSFVTKDGQNCGCANCLNQRWSYTDDMMLNNKQMSWLHPYHYGQHHSRPLKPLFGAGSSMSTFFPRRAGEQGSHVPAGSSEAQILIDSHPGLSKSKPIIQRSRRAMHCKQPQAAVDEIHMCGCNNQPEHHSCHNHAHLVRCNESSNSGSSDLTFDESIHCDNIKCSAYHPPKSKPKRVHNNRTNGHNHETTAWKLSSIKKASHNHHHHHHHNHHHQQQQQQQQLSSSEGSSIAQCTCSNRDQQPLLTANGSRYHHKSQQKRSTKLDRQAKRDKSMLVWSTNRDRLI